MNRYKFTKLLKDPNGVRFRSVTDYPKIFRKVDLNKLLNYKDFLRKINNKSEINFKSKKFNRKLFDDINLKFKLAYGRVNFSKKLSSNNSSIKNNR